MSDSEMMSILIFYHHSGFKCFKYYYEQIYAQLLSPGFVAQIPRNERSFPFGLSFSRHYGGTPC